MKYYLNNVEVGINEYITLFNSHNYDIQVENDETHLILNLDKRKQYLRRQRKKVFEEGFDIYKSNVAYGTIFETEEEHQENIKWYNNMLDIEKLENALQNIPERIKKFLN